MATRFRYAYGIQNGQRRIALNLDTTQGTYRRLRATSHSLKTSNRLSLKLGGGVGTSLVGINGMHCETQSAGFRKQRTDRKCAVSYVSLNRLDVHLPSSSELFGGHRVLRTRQGAHA